jgi:predicted aspartyl protease
MGAAAPACEAARAPAPALFDVPFDLVDGRIYVQAQVNDTGPFRFAVDTGASGMARADSRLVRTLALPPGGSALNFDGLQSAQATTVHIDSLSLGALRHRDIAAIARDYNARQPEPATFDGILARGFFSDGLLTIDYPRQRLQFTRGRGLSADQPDTLPYTRAFRIPVTIGTLQTEAQLDTGANVTLVLPSTQYAKASAAGLPAQRERLTLGHGELSSGRVHFGGTLQAGALTMRDFEVRVADRYPEAVIGAHALQASVVLIDQRSQRVAICPAAAAPASP